MKNILVVHQSAELYGSDKTLLLLLSKLDKDKVTAVVILPSQGPLKNELEKTGIVVEVAPVGKVYRSMFTPKNLYLFMKGIKKALNVMDKLDKTYHFDMVYSNTLAVLAGMFYARKKKLKHVWHVHEIITKPNFIANIFPKLLNRYATTVICNSHATKDNLTKRVKTLEKKCIVVHNGLEPEPEVGGNRAAKDLFGFGKDDIIVTLLGRIGWFKGHKWLLSTYIEYLKNSDIRIMIVGSPVPGQEYYQDELEQMINTNQLHNTIKIIPFTTKLKEIWDITDIGIVPSTEAEPFGLVAIEAMLEKKPVVASNHGGLKEIVVNNITGFLIEPHNNKDLAEAILKLAKDPELRQKYGEAGYKRAREKFSLENYIDGMSQALNS